MGDDCSCLYASLKEHYIPFLKFNGLEECIDCSGNGESDDCTKKLANNNDGLNKFYRDLIIYNKSIRS